MWESRTKSTSAAFWIVGLLFIDKIHILFALLLVVLLFLRLSKVYLSKIRATVRKVIPLLVLMMVTLILSHGLPPKMLIVYFAFKLCLRILTAVLLLLLVIGNETVDTYIVFLFEIGLPKNYMSILYLTNRFIHLLSTDLHNQMKALKARQFNLKTNLYAFKQIGYVLAGIFIKAYDKSHQVYRAMKSRAYTGMVGLVELQPIKFKDILLSTVFVSLMILAIYTNYKGVIIR